MRALFLFDAMISGVHLDDCKIEPKAADCELLQKLIESELSGGDGAVTEFDEYLKKEWSLFLETKQQIKVNLWGTNRDYKILSKLIVFDLVEYQRGEAAKGNDNVLKGEWISLFPAVHTVRISTGGSYYKFRLEALLETMKSLSPSVTVIVEDGYGAYKWAKKALTDGVSAAFKAEGWNMEYDDEHIGFFNKDKGGLIIKSNE